MLFGIEFHLADNRNQREEIKTASDNNEDNEIVIRINKVSTH